MELLFQLASTLALILGIILGEVLAIKSFGIIKNKIYYLLDILLFVCILVIALNKFIVPSFDLLRLIFVNFSIGFITIIFARGVVSLAGFLSKRTYEKIARPLDQEDFIIGLKTALKRRGFDENEIYRIAKEVGFNNKKIREIIYFPKLINKEEERNGMRTHHRKHK